MNGVTTWLNGVFGLDSTTTTRAIQVALAAPAAEPMSPAKQYEILRAYYANNSLYNRLQRAVVEVGLWQPAMKGLRNPAQRIVEFYTAHLWPGDLPAALPIVTPERDARGADQEDAQSVRLNTAVHQVWAWSNWARKKQVAARWLPMLGDCFLKVVRPADSPRVYFELIDPAYVTAFDTDARGYLTWLRLDVEIFATGAEVSSSLAPRRKWSTEVWSKAEQRYRRWVHEQPLTTPIDQLGTAVDTVAFAAMGIDFVPVVHIQFRDVGEPRGVGAFTLAVDKIDEVNLKATRFAQQLFRDNNSTWVLEGEGRDPAGRSVPPPSIDGRNGTTTRDGNTAGVAVGDNRLMSLPSGWHLRSMVPDLNFEASLAAILADLQELEQDCPEMSFWQISQGGVDASSLALRVRLKPAVARLLEVRGNAEDGLARADAMALTIGQAAKLPAFTTLGTYDQGDFEHWFAPREVVPLSEQELAATAQLEAEASVKKLAAGWSQAQVFRDAGLSDAEIERIQTEKASQDVLLGAEQ